MQQEEARPDSLYQWYRQLLALRQSRPELRDGSQQILCDDASAVLCILREEGGRRTLLLANLGKADARPSLDPALLHGMAWVDLLDRDASATPDAPLRPMQVRIVGTP